MSEVMLLYGILNLFWKSSSRGEPGTTIFLLSAYNLFYNSMRSIISTASIPLSMALNTLKILSLQPAIR
jgi:hypothetical protein